MLPKSIPKMKYQLQFTEGTGEKKHDWINVKFTLHDVLFFVSCATLGTFYIISKVFIFFSYVLVLTYLIIYIFLI